MGEVVTGAVVDEGVWCNGCGWFEPVTDLPDENAVCNDCGCLGEDHSYAKVVLK